MIVGCSDLLSLVYLWFFLMPVLLGFGGIGVGLYCMFSKDFEIMEDMVSSNVRLQAIVASGTRTLRERWLFIAGYSAMLSFSDMFIRRGKLLSEDIADVPKGLRRRLWWSQILMYTGLAWMVVISVVKTFII